MLTNIRKKIECKRGSTVWSWRMLVWLKDRFWLLGQGLTRSSIKISAYPLIKFPDYGRPFASASKRAEVHSLVCHKHLGLYLPAIKSLLRFYSRLTIVVHNDGSLTNRDKKILTKQIKNIRIINPEQADQLINTQISQFKKISNYRKNHLIAKQLIDYLLLAETDKIISLDSDTLFLRYPRQIIDWIEADNGQILYSYEQNPHGQKKFLSETGLDFPPNLCAGFMCLYRQILDLQLIEKLLNHLGAFDWWTTQNIYPALISQSDWADSAIGLNPSQYQSWCNFDNPEPIFRHYWASNGLSNEYLKDLHKIRKEFKKSNLNLESENPNVKA